MRLRTPISTDQGKGKATLRWRMSEGILMSGTIAKAPYGFVDIRSVRIPRSIEKKAHYKVRSLKRTD